MIRAYRRWRWTRETRELYRRVCAGAITPREYAHATAQADARWKISAARRRADGGAHATGASGYVCNLPEDHPGLCEWQKCPATAGLGTVIRWRVRCERERDHSGEHRQQHWVWR